MTKICRTCGQTKPETDFYALPRGAPGRRANCKACTSDWRREHYARSGGRDISFEQVLRQKYGITLDEYNALARRQAHRCAICRRPQHSRLRKGATEVRRLEVDHDHVTGTIRGLLCHRCNILVWALEDNHTTIDAIRRYVEEFRESFANGAPL